MSYLLKRGDLVGIAATSSPFDKELFQKGVQALKNLGFEAYFREDIFSKERYLAGLDARRAQELTELILNKKIKAIFFARGGYGSQRVIPHLDLKALKKNPKPLIGFSDLTALLNFFNQKLKFPILYGPVITQLGNGPSKRTLLNLKWHLTQKSPHPPLDLKNCRVLKEGKIKGKLAGGCLSLIVSSLKTPYELDCQNKILFFEDTDEKVYALDRMLTQLSNAGVLKKIKGVLIGTLEPKKGEPYSILAMLKDIFKDFNGPVVFGIPSGHTNDFIPLPLGVEVSIDAQLKKLEFKSPWLT